jgi:hypothetical protein
MYEVKFRERMIKNKPKKKKYSDQQRKEMHCDEPHLASNEKTQPIQWTEQPIGALVAPSSLWLNIGSLEGHS